MFTGRNDDLVARVLEHCGWPVDKGGLVPAMTKTERWYAIVEKFALRHRVRAALVGSLEQFEVSTHAIERDLDGCFKRHLRDRAFAKAHQLSGNSSCKSPIHSAADPRICPQSCFI